MEQNVIQISGGIMINVDASIKNICEKEYSVNSLYIIFDKVNEYFKEINENNYLTLVPTNESKE